MNKQTVLAALLLLVLAALWIKLHGVQIQAEPGSFVHRPGSALFERQGGTHVRLDAVPGKTPGWLRGAARNGIPVVVSVPTGGGQVFEFKIKGVSPRGELMAPCKTATDCAGILQALGLALPPELRPAP
jgi:hypothetical protein